MKSRPIQVEEKQEKKTKKWLRRGVAGSSRQTFNFVLSWEHPELEPRLFMVPVRWKEGEKREGGPALEFGLWNCGAKRSSGDFYNSPRSSRERTYSSPLPFIKNLKKRAEARQARKSKWMFCLIFGSTLSYFSIHILIQRNKLVLPSWAVPGERSTGGNCCWLVAWRRSFCHYATLFPSFLDPWPPFSAAPPCLCWPRRKKLSRGRLHPPSLYEHAERQFQLLFLRVENKGMKPSCWSKWIVALSHDNATISWIIT